MMNFKNAVMVVVSLLGMKEIRADGTWEPKVSLLNPSASFQRVATVDSSARVGVSDHVNQWQVGAGIGFLAEARQSTVTTWEIGYNRQYNFFDSIGLFWDLSVTDNPHNHKISAITLNYDRNFADRSSRASNPFLNVRIGYGYVNSENGKAEGLALSAGAGYRFFDPSDTQLQVGLKTTVVLDQINDEYPANFGIHTAVLF